MDGALLMTGPQSDHAMESRQFAKCSITALWLSLWHVHC